MKIKILILLALLTFESFAKPAWELKYDQQKWYWIYAQRLNNNEEALLVDFTKIEKTGENSFIYPAVLWSLKNNKFADKMEWYRADCKDRKNVRIGDFIDGSFTMSSNTKFSRVGSFGEAIMFMICGVQTSNKQTIFGIGGILEGEVFTNIGIIPDEVELNINNALENSVNFKIHRYDIPTGNLGAHYIYTTDCKKKNIYNILKPNEKIDFDDVSGAALKYPADFSCNYAEKNLWATNNKNENIVNKSPINIDEAKAKCKVLGFKEKTEKFGTCVLELTK
jgi:hypothetical protein